MNKKKTIIIIVSICTVIVVFLIIVFMKRRGSPSPDTPDPPICKTEDCIKHDTNSSCVSNECKCNNCYIGTYPNCKIDTSKIIVEIENQPEKTIQLVNNTSEDPLHIFLGIKIDEFTILGGAGKINGPIDFTKNAWDPLGAVKVSEVMIPIDKYIILKLPEDSRGAGNAFRVSPMKMKSGNDQFLFWIRCPRVSKEPQRHVWGSACNRQGVRQRYRCRQECDVEMESPPSNHSRQHCYRSRAHRSRRQDCRH